MYLGMSQQTMNHPFDRLAMMVEQYELYPGVAIVMFFHSLIDYSKCEGLYVSMLPCLLYVYVPEGYLMVDMLWQR